MLNVSDEQIKNPDSENHWTFDVEEETHEVFATWQADSENTQLAIYRGWQDETLLLAAGVDQTSDAGASTTLLAEGVQ